jgi:hypothetical protein
LTLARAIRFPENSDAASCLGFNGTDLGCVQPDRAAGLNLILIFANQIAEILLFWRMKSQKLGFYSTSHTRSDVPILGLSNPEILISVIQIAENLLFWRMKSLKSGFCAKIR